MKADQTLDCIGLYCPMPILKTSQQIKKMKIGEILEVAADDKGIKQDMPAWCKATGNECLGMEEQGGEIKVYVKKIKE
jgi:tRNA 2-thiouridine synthesizing protein A